ncbi:MAG: MFS transporter [bacterium]|nr:MFS transporter [bacterium]
MTTQTAAAPAVRTRPLSLLLIAYFAFIVMAIPDGVLNIAWTYMKDDFRVPLESLGVLLGVAMTGRLLTSFAAGLYVARIGMGAFLLAGIGMMGFGVVGYTLAPSWEILLVCVFIGTGGAGALDAGMNMVVAGAYTRGQLNWLHAAYGIGVTIGPILATFVIASLGQSWRAAYAFAFVPILVALGLVALTFARWSVGFTVEPGRKADSGAPSLWVSLRLPVVILSALLFFAYGGVEIGVGQLANTLFVESRGATQETASFWISLYWASFTIGRIVMGFVADRLKAAVLLRACLFAAVVGAFMLMTNLTTLIGFLGMAVMGFAFAPLFATLIAETPSRVGARHAANAVGIQVGVVGLGGAALPFVAGLLARPFGLEVIGVVLLAGALIMVALYETLVRLRPAAD